MSEGCRTESKIRTNLNLHPELDLNLHLEYFLWSKDGLLVRMLDYNSGDTGLIPSSVRDFVCL